MSALGPELASALLKNSQMTDFIILLLGALTGAVVFLPLGVGICANRHVNAGVPLSTQNNFIRLASSPPRDLSLVGKLVFVCLMLAWLCIFFGAWYLPFLGARMLDLPTDSPIVAKSILVAFGTGVVFFIGGYRFWKRRAYL